VHWGCGVVRTTALAIAFAGACDHTDRQQTLVLAGKTVLREGSDAAAGYALAWGTVGKKIRGTAFRYEGWYATLARTLAQRSASAAKEIKQLIARSEENVESGNTQVGKAGETINAIVVQVRGVNDLIAEMGAATREQTEGTGQVSGAVAQLDRMTQQNAALVEESAAASDSLSQQARRLVQAVGVFRT
jgi:hypothetical protein